MNVQISRTYQVAGLSFQDTRAVVDDAMIPNQEAILAGKAATAGLSGVMSGLAGGHGFTTQKIVCVKWATGARFNCSVTNAGANTITVDGATGHGDTLPTAGAVVISEKANLNWELDADLATRLHVGATVPALVSIEDDNGVLSHFELSAGQGKQWDAADWAANPLAGMSPTKVSAYATTAVGGIVTLYAGYNNA